MTRAILIFCLAAAAAISTATAQEVGSSLKQQCEGKILVLRHPLQGNSQEYDSDGKVRKGGAEGPWTIFGRLKVDEVGLSANKLLLKGHRVDYKLDPSVHQLAPFPNKIRVTVQISLNQLPQNLAEVDDVLGRVFALTKKDVVDSAPEFWRAYLDKNIPPRPPEEKAVVPAGQPDPPRSYWLAAQMCRKTMKQRSSRSGAAFSGPRPCLLQNPSSLTGPAANIMTASWF